jgi:hypothetical protein
MFYQTANGTWVLTGILSGAGDLMSGNMDLGPGTISVDLPDYLGQVDGDIDSVAIPEPATYAAILGLAALGLAVIHRQRAAVRKLARAA